MWQEIWRHHLEFTTATQLDESGSFLLLDPPGEWLVRHWLDGKSPLTPSWLNLLTAMRSSGLRELSYVIERFLYSVPPTASLPVEGAGEGGGTGRGTQSREQGELRQGLW